MLRSQRSYTTNHAPPFARLGIACAVLLAWPPAVLAQDATSPGATEPPPNFERDVLPILAQNCHECHGSEPQDSQLDLRTVTSMLRGGENGPAIVRGDPETSLLIDMLSRGEMPPGEQKLDAGHLELFRRWIVAGAPADEQVVELPAPSLVTDQERQFWAFEQPVRQAPPAVQHADRVRSPIDAFVLARLEEQGLSLSPDADRATLLRRACFDLTGLPPTPRELDEFLNDQRADAYEQLLDRLLASPQYGERWGRHWLDAAGYVDTRLFDGDLATIYINEGIWRYRDYVVRSFNADKPYDRFITEQVAGDELVDWQQAEQFNPETLELLVATGFLRSIEDHTSEPQYGIEKRYEVLFQLMEMVSTSLLGLTMECARCHDHKYDPIPQRDYYRLLACFEPSYNVHHWLKPQERYLADVSPAQRSAIDQQNAEADRQAAELQGQIAEIRRAFERRLFDARLAGLPEAIRADVQAAIGAPPDQRTAVQSYLADKLGPSLQVTAAEVDQSLDESAKISIADLEQRIRELATGKRSYSTVQALWDAGPTPVSRRMRRGNVHAPGAIVQPGFLEVLCRPGETDVQKPPQTQGASSGRRLALAQWFVSREHPLTARVIVNRAWHHHFGRGIVATLGNFGSSGSAPTHPELLDWLAVDFMEHGWSLKRLHKQIMTSTVYRQSSRRPPEQLDRLAAADPSLPAGETRSAPATDAAWQAILAAEQIDPENRLLWRMNLRRLEAEIVRDAVLAVSGNLDAAPAGPPVMITNPPDGLSAVKNEPTPTSQYRRSLYLLARRVYPLSFLEVFDSPIMPVNCTARMSSATVLQSLTFVNGSFVIDQAAQFAARVRQEPGDDAQEQVLLAYKLALSRAPTATEQEKCQSFLREQMQLYAGQGSPAERAQQQALADMCQMLLCTNEFLYIE